MRQLFLDTEFSGLSQRWPRLISIGLVSEDGEHSFYAELPTECYLPECTSWVRENIVPLLEGGDCVMEPDTLRHRLSDWLSRQGDARIATDAPDFDFAFLSAAVGVWPANVARKAIRFDSYALGSAHRDFVDAGRASYFESGMPAHHALHDAKALRHTWLQAQALDVFQIFLEGQS